MCYQRRAMKSVRKSCLYAIKYLLILLLSAGVGFALMVLAYTIPVDPVSKQASFKHMDLLGWDPLVNDHYELYTTYFDTFEPGVLNDTTDKIIISYAYGEPEVNPIYQAAFMYHYGRYWHGYVAILRPLFRLINYYDLPLINSMLQISLVLLLAVLAFKRTGKIRYSLAALSSYLLLMPIAVAFSLQFADVFYLSFIAGTLIVAFPKLCNRKNLYLLIFIFGILTAYFDFFTYHLLVWAYPLCWYLVVRDEEESYSLKEKIEDVVFSAIIWVAGYAGMCASKFVILYMVCGPEAFHDAFVAKGFVLMSGDFREFMVDKQTYSRLGVIYTNWRHYMYRGYELLISGWCVYYLTGLLRNKLNLSRNIIPLLIITLSSPAWFFVFYLHTAIHHSFTYRNFAASIFAFILIICKCVDSVKTEGTKNKIFRSSVLIVFFVIGWFLSGISRENIMDMFGGENDEYIVSQGDMLSFSFKPDHDNVRRIGLCALPVESLDGYVRMEFSDGSEKYTADLPMTGFAESALQTEDVNWNFDPDNEYTLTVTVEGNEDGARILLTKQGDMPLSEFTSGSLNGNVLGNVQPLSFMIYTADTKSPVDKGFIALVIALYAGIIAEVFAGMRSLIKTEGLR